MLIRRFSAADKPPVAPKLNVVVIPARGLLPPLQWARGSKNWLQHVCEAEPGVQIWEYEYPESQPPTMVAYIVSNSQRLLQSLEDLYPSNDAEAVPLVFICHGTGGYILKKALHFMGKQEPFHFRRIIDAISGGVFLGSPHIVSDLDQLKTILNLLLQYLHKGKGRTISSDEDAQYIFSVCREFERVNLSVPVVSVYESRETPVRQSRFKFLKSSNPIGGTESRCSMNGRNEVLVDGESNHFEICKLDIDRFAFQETFKLLRRVIENAPKQAQNVTRSYQEPEHRSGTLRSFSEAGDIRMMEDAMRTSLGISSPHGATDGSSTGSFELIPTVAGFETTNADPRLPCFSIGHQKRTRDFTGRRDVLELIDKHLIPEKSQDSDQVRSFVLCGLGGMGKTTVAIEYAYARRETFEAIFWLRADDVNILAEDFAKIAQLLGLEDPEKGQSNVAVSCGLVNGWLSRPLRKSNGPDSHDNEVSWLLIYDNVDNMDVLSEYWPTSGRGSVLITSRDPLTKSNMYTETGMDLPPLSHGESEELLQKLTRKMAGISQQQALSAITGHLGGLALAIDQMAAVIRDLRLSYLEFLKLYEKEGIGRLQVMATGTNTSSQNVRSLATTWALDMLSPATRTLLQVIAFLDQDAIPEEILKNAPPGLALDGYPKTDLEYLSARKDLLQSSLVSHHGDNERLSLHRLIQDTTRASLDDEQTSTFLQAAVTLLANVWPFQSLENHHTTSRFKQCARLLPCLLRIRHTVEALLCHGKAVPNDIQLANLFNDAGWYMFERGLQQETKPLCDLALRIAEIVGGNSAEVQQAIRDSYSFTGIAIVETNEHAESMRYKQLWLNMLLKRESAPGIPVRDYELAYAYNEIGVAYGNEQRLDEAVDAFIKSTEIFQGLENYDDTMLGWPQPNIGFMYWLQGRLDDAEEVLVEILDIYAHTYGVDDTNSFKTGKILYAMGNVLEAQGRYDESLNFHMRCLKQYKAALGESHHRTGDACLKMAGHCVRMGAYTEAESVYLKQAFKIFKAAKHSANELARATFKKAKLLKSISSESEYQATLQEAYEIRKQILPGDFRPMDKISDAEYDLLVPFWSR